RQKYQGRSRSDLLAQLKARWPDKTILGSGDVFTAEDAVRMLRDTGVNCVWIARGAIGNPWIFKQAALLAGAGLASPISSERAHEVRATQVSPLQPPTIHEQREALAEHFAIA